uniref:Ig-like domain-containing protein n=1 Tax=Xenopus tropicalis TaxID=8364 RepID=A0A803JG47_XENTR
MVTWGGTRDIRVNICVLQCPFCILGQFSDPTLSVSPYQPTEGDEITLVCSMRSEFNRITSRMMFAFSKNGRVVQELGSKYIYRIPSVTPKDSGYYTCDVTPETQNGTRRASAYVNVLELFSNPQIKVSPYPVAEGANMTLICSSDSLNGSAPLQFAFLRNGQEVKEFSSYEKYQIYKTQRDDSGYYSCEVRTIDGKVKKVSQTLIIHVQAFGGKNDSEEETLHADSQYIHQKHFLAFIISAAVSGILLIIVAALLFKYRQKCSALFTGQHSPPPPPGK